MPLAILIRTAQLTAKVEELSSQIVVRNTSEEIFKTQMQLLNHPQEKEALKHTL